MAAPAPVRRRAPKPGTRDALRFLMLTTFYPPHHFGGDAVAIRRLSHGLARRGHEVTVVHDVDAFTMLHKGPPPAPLIEPEGVRVVGLRSRLGPAAALATHQLGRPTLHRRALAALFAESPDVINFHNVSLLGAPALLGMGDPGAVRLYMAHEHWLVCPTHVLWRHGRERCEERQCLRCILHHRRPPQLWRATGSLPRALDGVDEFIAISEFSARKHREFGFPREMTVLPYGIPDREDDAAPVPTQERPYFLFVGRLERIKGLDDVIPAMARVPEFDLVIAGEGGHGSALRDLARGLPNVRFVGYQEAGSLRAWYRGCLALVVPSVCYETFGIIIAEAFRDRTPVLARRLGPFPELLDQSGAGLLFETADELIAGMHRLADDPAGREAMGESGRRAFVQRWSEEAVLPRYLEIIERVRARKAAA